MSHADEVKAAIAQIAQDAFNLVANGSAAVEEAQAAVRMLYVARDKLEGSRVYALQELEILQRIIVNLRQLDSNNIEAFQALVNFEKAKQLVEDYANRIALSIGKLDQYLNVVHHRVESEINASGQFVEQAIMNLNEFARQL